MTGKIWQAIEATVTADAREAIEYGLMEAGALGTETVERNGGTAQIIGYFEDQSAVEIVRAKLNTALEIYELAPAALIDLTAREFPEQDWLSEWKKHWQPVEVGRFIIAPSWSDIQVAADHIVLRIDPGMAFGTGTHETTRLCLKAI